MSPAVEAIVLHSTKFSESSVVIHTLSREYGRRSFLVRGLGKTGKGRHCSMSLFLPLSIIEMNIVENHRSSLFLARDIVCLHPLNGIRTNFFKNSISLFLSEVLFKAVSEGACEEGLFEWCREQIILLDAMESDFSNFHLYFLTNLMRLMGFSPERDDILPFSGNESILMSSLLESSFSEAMLLPMTGQQRNSLALSMIRYIEYHVESALNVKSLEILREIFS